MGLLRAMGPTLTVVLAAGACHQSPTPVATRNAAPVATLVPEPTPTPAPAPAPAPVAARTLEAATMPSELASPPSCKPAPKPETDHPCSVQALVSLPTDGSLIPFGDGSEGEVTWRGKLDPDDRDDLILLFHGTAGNWGEILFSAYLGCGNGGYAPVFGPDYALELLPTDREPSGYRRLRALSRNASHDHPGTITTELRFDASGCYSPVASATRAP